MKISKQNKNGKINKTLPHQNICTEKNKIKKTLPHQIEN